MPVCPIELVQSKKLRAFRGGRERVLDKATDLTDSCEAPRLTRCLSCLSKLRCLESAGYHLTVIYWDLDRILHLKLDRLQDLKVKWVISAPLALPE